MTVQDIATAVSGSLHDVPHPGALVTAPATFNPRVCKPGLYVALAGELDDGSFFDCHRFAAQAVRSGAVVVLADRPVGVPAIVVPNVRTALGALSAHLIRRLTGTTVIGITGSSGKTSTKDLTAQLLELAGPTLSTPGNNNDAVGQALTIPLAETSTRYLVLEMCTLGTGDIRRLAEIARPAVGAVLNVGTAHIGRLGSREAIAQAKGELVEALPTDGLAVLNADDPLVRAMAGRAQARVVLVGRAPDAEIRAEDVRLDGSGHAHFTLHTPEGSAPVALRLIGEHHVTNALTGAAIARHVGLSVDRIATALGRVKVVSEGRMQLFERPDGVTIVNDAFNANPQSMGASVTALAAMAGGGDTIAVLGEMSELGETSELAHRELGRLVAELGITALIAVGGREAAWLNEAARSHGAESVLVGSQQHAQALVRMLAEPGDVVLVKGSHRGGMQRLARELQADTIASAQPSLC